MDRQIENPTTGERITITGDNFATYTNEELGRVFRDYGDGRPYEYDDNGKLMKTSWTWVTDNPKHTPGPWEVSKDGTPDYAPQYTVYAEESGDRVATAFDTEANAALIAALQTVRLQVDAFCDTCDRPDPDSAEEPCEFCPLRVIYSAAYAALAKAEGR